MNRHIDWNQAEYSEFGRSAQISKHSLHQLPMFEEAALIELLDNYPRQWLQAFTMGTDPCRAEDWKSVDIADHSSGQDLWDAAKNGRIWFNVTHIEKYDEVYAGLIREMYEHLSAHCSHMPDMRANYSTLLISSPNAQVYYHLDSEPNMLWHLRGQKKIWIYPAMDTHFAPQEYIEDIYAGAIDEDLPFNTEFDQLSEQYLLSPGDVASWPHNGPHRIENLDMNVSLTTSYLTHETYKREYVQLANRFLLRKLGIKNRSMNEDGIVPSFKRFTYRAINKIIPFERSARAKNYVTDLQVDPEAENGLRKLDSELTASFARMRKTA